jgi:hypothetical protein
MTARALLRELSDAGIEVRRDGNHLRVRAPKGTLTPTLLDRLRQEKPLLLAALASPTRAIVRFRIRGDAGWATALGAPGETVDAVIADLRARHGTAIDIELAHRSHRA